MALFKALWAWLTRPSRRSSKKGHPDLNPYDVAKLIDELNLRSEARRLGEAGVPAPDAARAGGAEAEAIQRVDRIRQDYVDWAVTRLSILNEQLGKSDITQAVGRARQADREFERKASSLMNEREAVLRATRDRATQSEVELNEFKLRHGLTRQAVYPSGARSFFGYAFLAFLVVVEGLLNAAFFAQGLDSGLIGGAVYAMSLALLNVTVTYVIARWPSRYIYHRQPAFKLIGWFAVIFAVTAMLTVGLSIAQFRDALTAGSTNAPAEAMRALSQAPWTLKDLMSWGLFGLSVVFATAAFFDGMHSDDSYPGYGKVSRRTAEALGDYEEELQGLRADLDALRENELKLLDDTASAAQGSVARYASLIDDKRAAKLRLETALRDAENSLEAVLLTFRQENEVARKGLSRPAYFDQPTEFVKLTLPDFDTEGDERRLDEQQRLARALVAEVQEIRARIQAAYSKQFNLPLTLKQHFTASEAEA
jgi:hypothetical protein